MLTRVLVGMATAYGRMEPEPRQSWEEVVAGARAIQGFELLTSEQPYYSCATAKNMLLKKAQQRECDWVLLVDDDMVYTLRHIARLLSHKLPIVGALYPQRKHNELTWVCSAPVGKTTDNGLMEVGRTGGGFLLIATTAILKIEHDNPGLRYLSDAGVEQYQLFAERIGPDGEGIPRLIGDDFTFCNLARASGFKVYADSKCQVGHVGPVDYLRLHGQRLRVPQPV